MEQYYFIEKNGAKLGPYKLSELKQQTIYFNELIWRSDSDQWKKASEFNELSDLFIIKPPPTPKEQKITKVNRNFTGQIIGRLIFAYIITSFLIGIISFSIAQSSWEKYQTGTGGKYSRYPYYNPTIENFESYAGYGQEFLFRPFKAFVSTVYLTKEEQDNSNLLLGHLVLSSFASLSIIFLIIGIIYYAIKRTDVEDKPSNIKSNE